MENRLAADSSSAAGQRLRETRERDRKRGRRSSCTGRQIYHPSPHSVPERHPISSLHAHTHTPYCRSQILDSFRSLIKVAWNVFWLGLKQHSFSPSLICLAGIPLFPLLSSFPSLILKSPSLHKITASWNRRAFQRARQDDWGWEDDDVDRSVQSFLSWRLYLCSGRRRRFTKGLWDIWQPSHIHIHLHIHVHVQQSFISNIGPDMYMEQFK